MDDNGDWLAASFELLSEQYDKLKIVANEAEDDKDDYKENIGKFDKIQVLIAWDGFQSKQDVIEYINAYYNGFVDVSSHQRTLTDNNVFVQNFIDKKITFINNGNIMNRKEWFRYHNDFVVTTIKSAKLKDIQLLTWQSYAFTVSAHIQYASFAGEEHIEDKHIGSYVMSQYKARKVLHCHLTSEQDD